MIDRFLRYRTSILRCSPKKFKSIVHDLKGMLLNKAIEMLQISPKPVCVQMYKDFRCMKYNLINVIGLSEVLVNEMIISFIVIEKRRKNIGTRFRSKGRGIKSCTYDCSLAVYFSDFNNQKKDQ